jgi:hypothetical protein
VTLTGSSRVTCAAAMRDRFLRCGRDFTSHLLKATKNITCQNDKNSAYGILAKKKCHMRELEAWGRKKNIGNILPRRIRCGCEDLNQWGYNRDQWRTFVSVMI